ncbi:hypothetical protein BDV93DRAFT_606212 [Ceratobasidium sp. AG-I]|nr:hypothetical protein BDV93DRAFT_606212 [Ceratobasidium sp. AG-I]
MIQTERSTMVSPNPSSESVFVVDLNIDELMTGGAAEVNERDEKIFDMGDGDFGLWVNGTLFKTHAYLLKKFAGLKYLVKAALENVDPENKPIKSISVQRDERGVDDFQNMFKVLYASVVDGPFDFEPSTLVSALRIATVYDHPNLRAFAIKHLESVPLSAIERIRLSREFGLISWEGPAYIELCERDEAITKEEANVLGMDAFVHVAKIREIEQRRRGRVLDAGESEGEDSFSNAGADSELSGDDNKPTGPTQKKPKKKAARRSWSPVNLSTVDVTNAVPEGPKPWFVGIPIPSHAVAKPPIHDRILAQHFEIPGCECIAAVGGYAGTECRCRISPCVYEAVKALQAQQVAHATNIRNLEENIKGMEDCVISVPEAVPATPPVVTPVAAQVLKWLSDVQT